MSEPNAIGKLLIATANPAKVREFREMLGGADAAGGVAGPVWSDLSTHPATEPVAETGRTFRDNACIKAAAYARRFDSWALADDSGLEVDALGGRPGVHSARWAEMNAAEEAAPAVASAARSSRDADNNALLLRQLESVPDDQRTARFVCVLALADPKGRIVLSARDTVEGRIVREPRGAGGFGYDPLFLIDELGRTTAELSSDDKHRLSHRGKALRRMRGLMRRIGLL